MATPSQWALQRISRLRRYQPGTDPVQRAKDFGASQPVLDAIARYQEDPSMFPGYQGFTSVPSIAPTSSGGGFNVGGLITGVTTTLAGALAERISQGGGSPSSSQVADMKAAGFGMVPAEFLTSTAAPAAIVQSNGNCGCQPRPGRCEPQYIDRDFGAFGANPCSADPRYPRPTTFQGQEVCGPARKKPRMNPLNPRAAGRAARRLAAAGKAMKRIKKSVAAANRALQ